MVRSAVSREPLERGPQSRIGANVRDHPGRPDEAISVYVHSLRSRAGRPAKERSSIAERVASLCRERDSGADGLNSYLQRGPNG